MTTNIDELFTTGNDCAAGRQWPEAGAHFRDALSAIYGKVLEGTALGQIPSDQLEPILKELAATPMSSTLSKVPEALTALLGQLAEPIEVTTSCVAAFPIDHLPGLWTLVLCEEKHIVLGSGDETVSVCLPEGPATTFVVEFSDDSATIYLLSGSTSLRVSYAWAHLGQACVMSMTDQYYINQILIGDGDQAILSQARSYWNALLINPNQAWAMAHLADTYRILANGWPGYVGDLTAPFGRLARYMKALIYFEASLNLSPDSFWTNSHIGATIINARAFVSWSTTLPTPLLELMESWFGSGRTANVYDLLFVKKSIHHFVRSQELRGFYYPWSMAYYSSALLLLAMFTNDEVVGESMGILGRVVLEQSLYLQPSLLNQMFEAGQLYVNAILEAGLVYYFHRNYSVAWQYTWIGMKWMFDFKFLPGAQALAACQVLVNISYDAVVQQRTFSSPCIIDMSGLSDSSDGYFEVPPQPITKPNELCAFIDAAFARYCLPAVTPYLAPEVAVSTKIMVGLVSVLDTLANFIEILDAVNPDYPSTHIRDFAERLATKLGFEPLSYGKNGKPRPNRHSIVGETVYCKQTTGKPNYYIASQLRPLTTAQ